MYASFCGLASPSRVEFGLRITAVAVSRRMDMVSIEQESVSDCPLHFVSDVAGVHVGQLTDDNRHLHTFPLDRVRNGAFRRRVCCQLDASTAPVVCLCSNSRVYLSLTRPHSGRRRKEGPPKEVVVVVCGGLGATD